MISPQGVYRNRLHSIIAILTLCMQWPLVGAEESLEAAPIFDADTLLLMRFDEADEAVMIGDELAMDPVYSRMVANYRDGRFGGALKFVGRPGLRQCVMIPFPQRLFKVRDASRKDPKLFAEFLAPHVIVDNNRGYSIECWLYPQALQEQTVIAALNTGTHAPRAAWQIDLTEKGQVRFVCGSGLARFEMLSDQTVPLGQWTHLAIVCDPPANEKQKAVKGGDVRIYLNGQPASKVAWMERATLHRKPQPGSDGTTLAIGGPGIGAAEGFYDGMIDELRISKVPREFAPDPAVLIESRKELFLDDYLVARTCGIRRKLNQPQRYEGNPLLKSQGPWDERFIQHTGMFYDPKLRLFRSWYRGMDGPDTEAVNCYAFSRDGLHWEQPKLGLVDYNGSKANNIVIRRANGFYFRDPLAGPGEPYVCMTAKLNHGANGGPFKQILARSPEGIRWQSSAVESMSGYAGWPYVRLRGMQGAMAVDRPNITHPEYFAKIDKLVIVEKEGEGDSMKPYQFSRIGWDLQHWQDPVRSGLQRTEKNNQAWYGIRTWDMGNVMIGITDAYHGQKPNRWIDFQLASSRNGYHWRHVAEQETFFALGEKDKWDDGMVFTPQLIDVPGQDNYFIFYNGSAIYHDLVDGADYSRGPIYNIGVAFLRKDGFISVEPDGSTGMALLETKPIRFRGRHLYVNADAVGGSILVELADMKGNPLPGFGKAKPITTDHLRHVVQWGDNNDVTSLAEKPVIMRFHLTGKAKLYSYRFGPADPHQ